MVVVSAINILEYVVEVAFKGNGHFSIYDVIPVFPFIIQHRIPQNIKLVKPRIHIGRYIHFLYVPDLM